MMRHVTFIARKEVQYLLRMKETLLWLLVMPPVFMFFIGTVTQNFGGHGAAPEHLALTTPKNGGFLVDELARRLQENGYQVDHPATTENLARYQRQLRVPDDFTEQVLAGKPANVKFTQHADGLARELDQARVARATYTVLADLVACRLAGDTPGPESFERLRKMPRSVTVDVRPAGRRKQIPSGFEQSVPGILVMFALIVMLTSGAVALIAERDQGLLKRMASTPLSRGEVFTGKWLGRLAVGFVQIVFAMIAAKILFRMTWGPNWPMVMLVLLAWAAVCASLGMGLGTLARTDGQAIGLGVLASNVLAALGGCWWPVEITPPWMQTVAHALPTGWAMNALHQLISFQAGPTTVWPNLAALLALALVAGFLGARRFRFE